MIQHNGKRGYFHVFIMYLVPKCLYFTTIHQNFQLIWDILVMTLDFFRNSYLFEIFSSFGHVCLH